jgi:hypothetical protein
MDSNGSLGQDRPKVLATLEIAPTKEHKRGVRHRPRAAAAIGSNGPRPTQVQP